MYFPQTSLPSKLYIMINKILLIFKMHLSQFIFCLIPTIQCHYAKCLQCVYIESIKGICSHKFHLYYLADFHQSSSFQRNSHLTSLYTESYDGNDLSKLYQYLRSINLCYLVYLYINQSNIIYIRFLYITQGI